MPALPETSQHELFLVEQCGDTLVVAPRGDAVGFTPQAVAAEQNAIALILQREGVKHLVVDLDHANYFGSIVLGALVQMGHQVRAQRGRIALASASAEMLDVLRLMKLDQMWEIFPSRRSALRSVATIPLGERLWAQRKTAVALLVVVAVALTIVYFPRPNYGQRYYVEIAQLWRDAQARKDLAGEEEWERFLKRTEAKLEPMLQHMLRRSDSGKWTEAERYLIYIARDHWRRALARNSPYAEAHSRVVQHFLRCAEAVLENRPPPPLTSDIDLGDHVIRAGE